MSEPLNNFTRIKNIKRSAKIREKIRQGISTQSNNQESIRELKSIAPTDYSFLAGTGLLYANGSLNVQYSNIIDIIEEDMVQPLIVSGNITTEAPLLLDLLSYNADQITLHLSGEFTTAVVYLQMNNNDPEDTENANWKNIRKITMKTDEQYNRTIKCTALGYRFVIDSLTKVSDDSGVFGKLGGIF